MKITDIFVINLTVTGTIFNPPLRECFIYIHIFIFSLKTATAYLITVAIIIIIKIKPSKSLRKLGGFFKS